MFKKLLKIIILIILMLFMHIIANAEEDYMLKKYDIVPDVYVTKINSEHQIFDYMYIIARSSDNAFVYCIEPGIHINNNAKYYGIDDTLNSNITKEQYERIKLISYYGYGYQDQNVNHTDKKWYAVTQGLIWQVESNNHEIYFTNYLQGPKVDKFINEYNEINSLINKHHKTPSFINMTKEMSLGESITLTDTNNTLESYNIRTSNNNISINKQGNNLQITALKNGSSTITLTKEFKYYNTNPLIYTASNSQTLFKVGNLEPITATLNINITGNKVIINKVDHDTEKFEQISDATLSNAVYGLYDTNNNLLEKLTINSNGISKSSNILELNETYYIKELNPSIGYELDEDKHYFTVNSKETFITLKEQIIKRKVNIYKQTKEYQNIPSTSEKDIKFNIYLKSSKSLFSSVITDENGKASTTLPYGTYIFKQENTYDNYDKVEDFEVVIDKADIPIEINLINKIISSKIKVIKINSENNEIIPLSNILFKIKNLDNNEYICENESCNYSSINGIFITKSLPYGNYQLEEISDYIPGYNINHNPLIFTISEESNFIKDNNNDIIIELKFPNNPSYSTIIINKIDKDTKEPIPNTLINIFDENNQLIHSALTNEEGQIKFNKLKLGKYYYQEIEPAPKYILDKETHCFSVNTNNELIKETITNKKENIPELIKVPFTYKNKYYSNIYPIITSFLGIIFIKRKTNKC